MPAEAVPNRGIAASPSKAVISISTESLGSEPNSRAASMTALNEPVVMAAPLVDISLPETTPTLPESQQVPEHPNFVEYKAQCKHMGIVPVGMLCKQILEGVIQVPYYGIDDRGARALGVLLNVRHPLCDRCQRFSILLRSYQIL